eukprot:Blabericola_migrator_1__11412@NODE_677_length_6914_cov_138_051994_g491_i0_p1_GENE_NODE_677_length_6914_cov_138_051994_g491_i0NODE_677_length_6914_cov_138_051994_g491_i0_p1_ORF_typecomplete_len1284_score255_89ABC_membrane/PF00664_23/4e51ABC_membrane/PF00664_23/4_1e45ABC_tran/PF00005_27/2_7e41ABC_tran/PF00005_27/2e40SMC_N/PF02463_19/1_9e02SMC_N/PF02463_19/1_6e05SMC_N/PF02463_19/1_6e02SMC_N/PF02463_19/4e05AAA_21/PF13304_6/0_00012AAA_21/PF13304_6/0_0046AAA/PF00004_29/0_00039AAA/PF00004_29/0_0043AAA_
MELDLNDEADSIAVCSQVSEDTPTSKGVGFNALRYSSHVDRILIVIGLLASTASGVLSPLFMYIFGDMIRGLGGSPKHDMNYYVFWLMKLGAIAFALCWIGACLMEMAAERQLRALKSRFLKSLMRQEMAWFDQHDPGRLASMLNQNTTMIRDGIGAKLAQFGTCVGIFFGGYAVAFSRSWKLTLVMIAALPVVALAGYTLMSAMASFGALSVSYSEAGAVAEEALATIRSVAAFGLEQRLAQKFGRLVTRVYKKGIREAVKGGFGLGFTFFAIAANFGLAFWYSGKLVAGDLEEYGFGCFDGSADCFLGGDAVGVFACAILAAFALGQASPSLGALSAAGAAVNVLDPIINRKSRIDAESEEGVTALNLQGEIELKNVRFSYPCKKDLIVFRDLNLIIEPGTSVALVGGSGCGKSTIVQLIERFYDVSNGSILIDGVDIRDYNIKWLRRRMALVSQEPRLFAATIYENIAGDTEASMEEVIEAAKAANAHNYILKFPQGYNTYVGEAGSQLSGGQKQRIAIARAILRNPSILILDEATSALDNESERIVQETLDQVVAHRGCTTIIIAHRLTTVRKADKIIVLDNRGDGAYVVEEGSHEELLAIPGGLYASLVASQTMPSDAEHELPEELSDIIKHVKKDDGSAILSKGASLVHLKAKYSHTQGSSVLGSILANSKDYEALKPCQGGLLRRTFHFMRSGKLALCLGCLGAVLCGGYWPSLGILVARIVTGLSGTDPAEVRSTADTTGLAFFGVALGVLLAQALHKSGLGIVGEKVVWAIRVKLFETILHQDIAFFDDPDHTQGSLSSLLASDVLALKGWASENIGVYLESITTLVVAVTVSFIASVKLGAVCLAGFAIMAPATMLQARFMSGSGGGSSNSSDEIADTQTTATILNEVLMNLRTVTAYTLQSKFNGRYLDLVDKQFKAGEKQAVLAGLAYGLSQGLPFYVQALCVWYGGRQISAGAISLEEMLRSILSLILSAMGLGMTMMFVTNASQARESAARVYEMLDTKVSLDSRLPDGVDMPNEVEEIKFEHVKFYYPQRPDVRVYRDITFEIKQGEVVAFVGASGCGKSTAVQLLERFYEYSGGRIMINDLNLRDINLRCLRSSMGLVSQEPVLFDDTIEENIALGKPTDASAEEVEAAAKLANAWTFIQESPDGLQTVVGKLGGRLSGGQKQRIAIARALIRNPQILILDEATSALDAESEKVVQQALDELLKTNQRTTVVIAHRLSTIRNADKIVVFVNPDGNGSRVAEVGTHSQLMKIPGGVYRGLVNIAQGAA